MIKSGREEIIYLLNKCIEKYQLESGKEVIQNTNRKNYEGLAITLSDISNQLPYTNEEFGHDVYEKDTRIKEVGFPFRKYDITGGQLKDALIGLVGNPRNFMVDACYIYLYKKSKKAFKENPSDTGLAEIINSTIKSDSYSLIKENQDLKLKIVRLEKIKGSSYFNKKILPFMLLLFAIIIISLTITTKLYFNRNYELSSLKKDLNIVPYKVTQQEIEKLEGIWICYTGSPQARVSDSDRYHKIVPNIVELKYKDGYFIYKRYGASFNHIGFAQFESQNIVSVFSKIDEPNNANKEDGSVSVESPRHSLLELTKDSLITSISASWNFDYGKNNKIIGIREVYKKIGGLRNLLEKTNTLENASCKCKIIQWEELINNKKVTQSFYLKNMILDSTSHKELFPFLDENSILFKDPINDTILKTGFR